MCGHNFEETLTLGWHTVVTIAILAGVCWLIWTFIKPIAIVVGLGLGVVGTLWLIGCIVKQIQKKLEKL